MKRKIFRQYADFVANEFGITIDDIFSDSIKRKHSVPRHMLFYLSWKRGMTTTMIAEYMQSFGATTLHPAVLKGCERMDVKVKNDKDYYLLFKKIQACIE
jgi:chromosomal replication initiation ATPase DnaA